MFAPFLFKRYCDRVQKYVESLTKKTKPKKVLVCMIYYLDENVVPSWAGTALKAMVYDRNPDRLQTMIRKKFSEATRYVHKAVAYLEYGVIDDFVNKSVTIYTSLDIYAR